MVSSLMLNEITYIYAKAGGEGEEQVDDYGLPKWEESDHSDGNRLSRMNLFSKPSVPDVEQLIEYDGASEEGYDVVTNFGDEFIKVGSYETYEEALAAYEARAKMRSAGTPAIVSGRAVVKYNVGLVSYRSGTSSTLNIYADEGLTKKITYIESSGAYGADALYLNTSNSGAAVQVKVAGVTGWMSASSVTIATDMDNTYSSYYKVDNNNRIKHYVNNNINDYNAYSVIDVGANEIGLTKGKPYFSYDGHYFYEDYTPMTNDYRSGTYSHSVNASKPYYNYYQYLSHRTKSSYDVNAIKNYITNTLGFTSKVKNINNGPAGNESQFYGEENAFIDNQNLYGANAIMMLSLASNESANGRSEIAYTKNNLFGHSAYDSNPGSSSSKYSTVSKSIEAHAKVFISDSYADPIDYSGRGNGSFFGDKGSGMNISYASDPYWGEKAAAFYSAIDQKMGNKDYQKYTIGIAKEKTSIKVKKETSDSSSTLYEISDLPSYSFLILGEINGYYKIQSDPTLNANRTGIQQSKYVYDFNNDYGYIKKSDVAYVYGTVKNLDDGVQTYLKGDVNGDGNVTSIDYMMIKNHIMNTDTLTGDKLKRADVSGDGKITSVDYMMIKNHIMGTDRLF